jgi:hypothetical protein
VDDVVGPAGVVSLELEQPAANAKTSAVTPSAPCFIPIFITYSIPWGHRELHPSCRGARIGIWAGSRVPRCAGAYVSRRHRRTEALADRQAERIDRSEASLLEARWAGARARKRPNTA